jgi:hypothetical protein
MEGLCIGLTFGSFWEDGVREALAPGIGRTFGGVLEQEGQRDQSLMVCPKMRSLDMAWFL